MRTILRFPCRTSTHPANGGGGWGITPLPLFPSNGGPPPTHVSGQVGDTLPPREGAGPDPERAGTGTSLTNNSETFTFLLARTNDPVCLRKQKQ